MMTGTKAYACSELSDTTVIGPTTYSSQQQQRHIFPQIFLVCSWLSLWVWNPWTQRTKCTWIALAQHFKKILSHFAFSSSSEFQCTISLIRILLYTVWRKNHNYRKTWNLTPAQCIICRIIYKVLSSWELSCLVSGTVASLTDKRVPWLGLSEKAFRPWATHRTYPAGRSAAPASFTFPCLARADDWLANDG